MISQLQKKNMADMQQNQLLEAKEANLSVFLKELHEMNTIDNHRRYAVEGMMIEH